MRERTALLALFLVVLAPACALGYGDSFTRLVDVQTAHALPRAGYSLAVRVVPDGGLQTGLAVGITDYISVGVSYGAGNVIGSGEPDWDEEIEFELKIRLAEEFDITPGLAIGYDSRGYGAHTEDGGYFKASQGLYLAAVKTAPFSEFWQFHGGVSRTLELEKSGPDFFLGVSARFSLEFSILAEYQLAVDRTEEDSDSKTGYLNAGLRWVFSEQLELDFYFRNLIGPSGSPELSSRSIAFAYYSTF